MKQTILAVLVVTMMIGGGVAVQKRLQAQAGQGAAPPLSTFTAPAWSDIPLNPNQPDRVTHWSVDTFAKVHAELASRAAKGQPLNARDLLPLPMARTHGYTAGYRTGKEPPSAEQHEGVTDVYFVMGGSATMTTGGELVGKRPLIDGEYRGTSVQGGETHRLKAGDVAARPAQPAALRTSRCRRVLLPSAQDQRRSVSVADCRGRLRSRQRGCAAGTESA